MRKGNSKSGLSSLYGTYKIIARKRGHAFELTKSEFRELTKGRCWYCEIGPHQVKHARQCNDFYLYNGIDRVNNAEGYTFRNCVSCCGACNRMKNNLSSELFIAQIRKIAGNFGFLE